MRLVDRLAAARRRGFVGREPELRRFSDLLAETDEPRVVFVHGPGGVGKTALLHQFAWLGEQAGRQAVWLDGRETPPDAAAVLRSLCAEFGGDAGDLEFLCQWKNVVLLIDTYESLTTLDRWLRDEFIPYLPLEWVVVLAGRDRPSLGWRTDPGWRELLTEMRLENLGPSDGRELLRRRGVPEAQHGDALAFTRGHPLALALVADVSAHRGFSPTAAPEVVATLLKSFIDAVPTASHRRALEACSLVMVVTEPLLAALLDRPRSDDLFEWLRGLSIIEQGPRGLFPHDLVRDVLATEMRWRDPTGCEDVRARAAAHFRQQLRTAAPAARQTILLDLIYLHRDRSVLGPFLGSARDLDAGRFAVTAPSASEWPLLRSWVERHEGSESAALFDLWRARQPDAFLVVREGTGDPAGFFMLLRLEDAERGIDPAVDRVLPRLRGLAEEETALLVRFWMAGEGYQELSAVQTFITLYLSRSYLSTPFLAATFLPFSEPDFWTEGCAHLGYERLPDGDFTVGGHTYGTYWHDWRATPPLAWLAALAERETGEPLAMGAAPSLDRAAFDDAVRDALRGMGRADGLRDSPLLGTRMVTAAGGDPVTALRRLIEEAAGELAASPRDRRAHRALYHTYLKPAETQARAAELLDLPMSTFRRHLAAGIDRLAALLWQREQEA